jgi:hypothetical protein
VDARETAKKLADAVLGPEPSRARTFAGDEAAYAGPLARTCGHRDHRRKRRRAEPHPNWRAGSGPGDARVPRRRDVAVSDTLVTFERQGGRVWRLRLDTGSGHVVTCPAGVS